MSPPTPGVRNHLVQATGGSGPADKHKKYSLFFVYIFFLPQMYENHRKDELKVYKLEKLKI